jgi:hypothetical protein
MVVSHQEPPGDGEGKDGALLAQLRTQEKQHLRERQYVETRKRTAAPGA